MSKMNYRRKDWKVKVRVPPMLRPNKAIDPDTLYARDREKKQWKKVVKDYTENGIIDEDI